jgi:hypothetical protein
MRELNEGLAALDPVAALSRRFKIPLAMIEAAGVRHENDSRVRELLGIFGRPDQDLRGIVFPYRDPRDGRTLGHRVRLDTVTADGNKYLSEQRCRALFFGPTHVDELNDTSIHVAIVEAEQSALALSAFAARSNCVLLTIAVGGVWGWKRKSGNALQPDGSRQPVSGPSPSLDLVTWPHRKVVIAFDSNITVRLDLLNARRALAEELAGRGADVFLATVPQKNGINGPDDLIAIEGDAATLEMINGATPLRPAQSSPKSNERESAATFIVNLARSHAQLFHDGEDSFATIQVYDHLETYFIRSRQFRGYLGKMFFEGKGRAASGEALTSAIATLEGFARFESAEGVASLRVAGDCEHIWVDLCDPQWRQVEIDASGWRVVESTSSHIRFRRPPGMLPLPMPESGGSLSELRKFFNVETDSDFHLIVGWALSAFHPTGPYPLLILHGVQGSAKSTAARFGRLLVDPNFSLLRCEPREPRDLMVAANNAWVISFDNISRLEPWLSDALCRLSTGGGFSTRTLYTDNEETIFNAKRPAIVNGIEEVATRGDILDRSILLYLPVIRQKDRKEERVINQEFHAAHPRLFGALLDATSAAIRNHNLVNVKNLPRMADTARWITGAEEQIGWSRGTFLRALQENRAHANELPLENPVAELIRKMTLPWKGTATELLKVLEANADEGARNKRTWPVSGAVLSNSLRRIASNLREVDGINVKFGERSTDSSRRRLITVTQGEKEGNWSSELSDTVTGPDVSDDADSKKQPFSGGRVREEGPIEEGEL